MIDWFSRLVMRLVLFAIMFVSVSILGCSQAFNWSQLSTNVTHPAARATSMEYDGWRSMTVLWGGQYGSASEQFNDTWLFNGVIWTQASGNGTNGPSSRRSFASTFDSTRGVVVLFGGETGSGQVFGDLWEWNGQLWIQKTASTGVWPCARGGARMAFDKKNGVVVLFGGWANGGWLNDLWTWDGSSWTQKQVSTKPSPRSSHVFVYDEARNVVVLHGGTGSRAELFNDTWTWNGETWNQLSVAGPNARFESAAAYDSLRSRLILFGGTNFQQYFSDCWAWDGQQWSQLMQSGPAARASAAMCFDSLRDRLVLFGGHNGNYYLEDTWMFGPDLTYTEVRLNDSANTGLAGGIVQYYLNGWKSFGTTDAQGKASGYLTPGSYTFRLTWEGFANDKSQNISANRYVVFRTTRVLAQLTNSLNTKLDTGNVRFYSGGWRDMGNTTGGEVARELLPGIYTFRMIYEGAAQDKMQDVGTNPIVIYQTANVEVHLRDSAAFNLDGGTVKFYAGGWRDFGVTVDGKVSRELLPAGYTFRMIFNGAVNDKFQTISGNSDVEFQTRNITVQLKNNAGEFIAEAGAVQFYAGGWRSFGVTVSGQVSRELLPAAYTFRMTYEGASRDQVYTVADDAIIAFQTVRVTVQLKNSTGGDLDAGTVKFYANGWRDLGITSSGSVSKELLPGSYTWRMIFLGGNKDQVKDVSNDPVVAFQTGRVESDSNSCTYFYANGWKTFYSGIELLPLQYVFRFDDGTIDTPYTISPGQVNTIH